MVYGLAHLGKSLFWYSSEILFAYFLTEYVGLSASRMGMVLAAGFLVSALIDIAMGVGLRRWLAAPGSASRMQLLGAVLCSVALALVFLGAMIPAEARFLYALGAGVTFRFAFAAYDIPQNALMALATRDADSRFRVASTRIWFSGAATLIVAAAVGPVIGMRGNAGGSWLLLGLTGLFALVAISSAWLLFRLLGDAEAVVTPKQHPSPRGSSLPADFWWLLFVMFVTSMFTPAFSKLEPYYATYVLRSAWWGGIVILLMATGIFAGQPLWVHLCRRMSFGAVMLIAAVTQIVALLVFWLTGASAPAIAAAAAFAFGLGNGGVGMVQWAAFSASVTRLGPDRAGLSYGLFAATGKAALAAGGLLLAAALVRVDLRGTDGLDLITVMMAISLAGAISCVIAAIGLHAWAGRAGTRVPL
ncbi:MFS transporter [Sphingomonas sp. H39-1-10]|uniref:MFS transporter n=1 Tax=Sphingomonas pollutisoli TaxID=3030829 RepID=UPI0023B8943C|nr:MFS transporter [Sphingomonas pollutisoli]MDF0490166.1 MFS transporter [Sphingomonas pollutisoli]